MGSVFGDLFTVATFGESHGAAIGCIIDGCPAGLALDAQDIAAEMVRRIPGNSPYASKRKEADEVEILSGVFDGITTGTPITLVIYNRDQRPEDYNELARVFRPGHGDFTYTAKYGIRDHRGGGRASGRETAARVAAGAVAKKILAELGVTVAVQASAIDYAELEKCMAAGDSMGSMVEGKINGLVAGIGEPVFDKLSADLAKALMSIGGAAGIEFGTGFAVVNSRGSENNDGFAWSNDKISKTTNNSGGMMAGISDGDEICFRLAFKPPSSIAMPQNTANMDGDNVKISIRGRHDPIIAPRAAVVAEAMAAIVLVNHIFGSLTDTIWQVKKAYKKDLPY